MDDPDIAILDDPDIAILPDKMKRLVEFPFLHKFPLHKPMQ